MDFSSRCRFKNGDSRLPAGHEDVKDPDILVEANSAVQSTEDLQNEVKLEKGSDIYGAYASTLNAVDLLCESGVQEEIFSDYQFPDEEKKPFGQDDMFEDVKNPEILLDTSLTGPIAPTSEGLQNEVNESQNNEFRRRATLNAADLLDSDESVDDEEEMSFAEDGTSSKKEHPQQPTFFVRRHLFTCPVKKCSFSYRKFNRIRGHMQFHLDSQEFFCDVCEKDFSSKEEVIAHIQERQKKECCACGRKCSSASVLTDHLRCHTGERPFVCMTCGQRFSRNSHLNNHLLTHTGEKPFSCGLCEKRFTQKCLLKEHEIRHTGEKPYKCNQCDYRSTNASYLKRHNRIHTGEKPFVCGHCEKRFAQTNYLKKHEMTHSGEKPFGCSDCGRRFTQRAKLTGHVRVLHSNKKPFETTQRAHEE